MEYPKHDYKEYPKTLDPDDLWGQVRRTVHGKPVAAEQIDMIVAAIRDGLALTKPDYLLDLACGNGALSRYFFEDCHALYGVDYSEYLIEVAKRNFERQPDYAFQYSDAASYVEGEPTPERFTKVLCYGSFSFFPAADARRVLAGLRQRFVNVQRVYLGNLPDRDRATNFYQPGKDFSAELDQNESQIGIWRSKAQLTELAAECGWATRFYDMPASFFASHYRYDAVLTPLA